MKKSLLLLILIVAIGGTIYYLESTKPDIAAPEQIAQTTAENTQQTNNTYPPAQEITTPDGFINSEPFELKDYIGKKVILVDFWTYSCINCQRTLPHLNQWHDKYADDGLLIVGIHTPEFGFEHEYDNVKQAVEKFKIKYPVVLDNDYSTWRAYKNRFWPRKYLIDKNGYIVYDHIGEGGYEETEKEIQRLLSELNNNFTAEDISMPKDAIDVNFSMVKSPETYFGSDRNEYLGNGTAGKLGLQTLTLPKTPSVNTLYLEGDWVFHPEYATNRNGRGTIVYKYSAKNVYLVANSTEGATVTIKQDGKVVDENVQITDDKLYEIIKGNGYGEHLLEIEITDGELNAFAFTFG